jgi:hypothetical protein
LAYHSDGYGVPLSALKATPPMLLAVYQKASKLKTGISSPWVTIRWVIAFQYWPGDCDASPSLSSLSSVGSSQPCWFSALFGASWSAYHSDSGANAVAMNPVA